MEELDTVVIVSALVTMVAVCVELAALWLTLEEERPRKKRRMPGGAHAGKKLKTTIVGEINNALSSVALAIHALAESINTTESFHSLIKKVIAVVTSLPFIPPQAHVHVIEYLAQNERRANIFLALNDQMKQQWFEMHFPPGSSSSSP
ncbi:hypothetical protein CKAN_00544900 [Cinnamomum micranthum f. kanehirae]|uniref:Uncharacterized protein n=1 Tax=Cinnamomum micranthum f. kanehirae TaxID=337451 RepID=A0A443NEN2_9MAGN|nr:hypothetical protein CKAN_00544900 [Cinnamomum micranthum f. kanehirae]